MTRSAAASIWTLRRRVIAITLSMVWLFIGGLFLAALLNTQPTEVTYGDDKAFVTLSTNKSLALTHIQCIDFKWSAQNLALYKTAEPIFPRELQPAQGEKQACNSQEARVVGQFVPEVLNDAYPQTVWINTGALLFVGIASIVVAILLWQPAWLGPISQYETHLTLAALVIIFALLTRVVNPLEMDFSIVLATLAVVPLSVIGFGILYIFRKRPAQLFKAVCMVMLLVTTLLTAYHLFTVPGMLNHDERYYVSIAATGNAGLGLYPYIQDYPPMPIMGGIGHMAWFYVLAYNLFGPSIWGLRLVPFLFYLLSLPAIFILFRRWYGTATAWLAIALIPTTYFYTISHSLRMDTMVLTWLWWGLLLVDVARQKQNWRWHFAAGLFLGLGLQTHVHTSITTIACGILYLVDYAREVRRAGRFVWPSAVVAYSLGALSAVGIYVIINILPNPDSFLRTAGSAARLTAIYVEENPSLLRRVLNSFVALEVFVQNALKRVLFLFQFVPLFDFMLGLVAFVTLLTRRRGPADITSLILIPGVLIVGFFILNGPSTYYTLHMFPVIVMCFPAFFTHGYMRRGPLLIAWEEVRLPLMLVLLTLIFPLYLTISLTSPAALEYDILLADKYRDDITYIQQNVSRECIVMGPGYLYQNEFLDYARFNTHTAEIGLGRRFYGFDEDYDEMWPEMNPDIIFGHFEEEFAPSLERYIEAKQYREVAPDIWLKTHEPLTPGCIITDKAP